MKSERKWHKGPPPFAGWWAARVKPSREAAGEHWGWWSGEKWSVFASPSNSAVEAENTAAEIGSYSGATAHVEWCDYWPEDARVPRIAP